MEHIAALCVDRSYVTATMVSHSLQGAKLMQKLHALLQDKCCPRSNQKVHQHLFLSQQHSSEQDCTRLSFCIRFVSRKLYLTAFAVT